MVAPDLPETADIDPVADHRYSFEDFELWPKRRLLIRGETPVPIGGRALDLLIALVERAGRVVSKTELFALVWPNMAVEESNLRVHIAAVRKALGGAQFITSVPGRGYSFVADAVRTSGRAEDAPQQAETPPDHADFPAALTPLFGRDDVIAELS
ncbi:MAG TPA: transcriptional regulator, partial [Rhizomicrobium sp.]|nr:transcriptional regulator [Rhizomicrobium sp.]